MSGVNTNAGAPITLDFLEEIIAVSWGGIAWLLINAEISGSVNSSTPPPYGSFSYKLPKGASLIWQDVPLKKQSGGTAPDNYYFPWPDTVAAPTLANWQQIINGQPNLPIHQWSVEGTGICINNILSGAPQPDKTWWYSTKANAQAAASWINTNYSGGSGPLAPPIPWLNLDGTESFFPPPVNFSVQQINKTTTLSNTVYNARFLFKVPAAKTDFPFTTNVPGGCSQQGWASVFTAQTNVIKTLNDLRGLADRSGHLLLGGSQTTLITTVGKSKHGTLAINGVAGFSPGLSPNADVSS